MSYTSLPSGVRQVVANAADAAALFVGPCVWMAPGARGFGGVAGGNGVASEHVRSPRHALQVLEVYAPRSAAQVIDLHPSRDRAYEIFVGPSMCTNQLVSGPMSDREESIWMGSLLDSPRPYPAATGRHLDQTEKSLYRRQGHATSLHAKSICLPVVSRPPTNRTHPGEQHQMLRKVYTV